MSSQPVCDVVIVNWNTGQLLGQCLASLAALRCRNSMLGSVVVVDNASTDGSANSLPATDLPIKVIRNASNEGFARACNQGALAGRAANILFLNPDTALPPDCLDSLFEWRRLQPAYARAVIGIQLLDLQGRISVTCSRFPTIGRVLAKTLGIEQSVARFGWSQPMLEFDHAVSREVDQVMGAFFLVPRLLFEELGGFSEHYFLYYEEVDFCWRARAAGAPSVFCAAARAMHVGGGSSAAVPAQRLFLNLRSRLVYYRHRFGLTAYLAAAALTLIGEPVTRLVQAALNRQAGQIGHVFSAYAMLYRDLLGPGRRSDR